MDIARRSFYSATPDPLVSNNLETPQWNAHETMRCGICGTVVLRLL